MEVCERNECKEEIRSRAENATCRLNEMRLDHCWEIENADVQLGEKIFRGERKVRGSRGGGKKMDWV